MYIAKIKNGLQQKHLCQMTKTNTKYYDQRFKCLTGKQIVCFVAKLVKRM